MRKLGLVLCAFLAACAIERRGVDAPADDLYYPIGILAHPSGNYAYVVNANFDLRYNSGSVSVIDLNAALPFGQEDPGDPYNRRAIVGVERVLSFGGLPAFNGDASRMFVPVREESTVHVLDVAGDGSSLDCGEKGFRRPLTCDSLHSYKLSGSLFAPELGEADTADPFMAAVSPAALGLPGEFLFLTHLSSGAISVFDVTPNAVSNPNGFASVALVGVGVNGTSAVAVASGPGRKPMIYAGSNRLLTVRNPSPATLYFFEPSLALTGEGASGAIGLAAKIGGSDVKHLVTNPDGSRTYMLLRDPDSLVVFDTTLAATGEPANKILATIPLEKQPSVMTYVRRTPPLVDLLYVAAFGDDSIAIFDATTYALVGRAQAGVLEDGPYGLAVASTPERTWVLATFFNNDAVVVFDATDPDPRKHGTIMRIGSPRASKK